MPSSTTTARSRDNSGSTAGSRPSCFRDCARRLIVAPQAISPVTEPRDVAFATLIEGAALATKVLAADRQAIGTGDLYDDGYFARFAEGGAGPILEQRINQAIASVAAHIIGAWEAAGRPDLSKPGPPRVPQRKRAPRTPAAQLPG